MPNRIRQIADLGQALWLDFISRELLRSGKLRALIDEGVSGMTSNPTILQKSVSAGSEYDEQIRSLATSGKSTYEIYEALAFQDISAAADQLRGVYDQSNAADGFVSLEVDPKLAHDTEQTISEARRIFTTIARPNVMIKVPATDAGLPAITALIGEGINVNVTLIFAISMYERVVQAYLDGLRKLRQAGKPLDAVASVASFFVSRIDTLTDKRLGERIEKAREDLEPLLGQAANASAKIAYDRYRTVFEGAPFAELRAVGARVQRPLWASTSTKNPAYPDTKYVDPLIGPNTVNTLPPHALDAVRDHGIAARTIDQDVDQAHTTMKELRAGGIDLDAITDQLLVDGVKAFADSFERLLADIETKRANFAK
jgi:transaldolase